MSTGNWTEADVEAIKRRISKTFDVAEAKAAKPSKYRNVKTMVDGFVFDSKREAQFWNELKLREKAGEIGDLDRQVSFALCTVDADGVRVVVANYVSDFRFYDRPMQRVRIVDIKGAKETAMFALKRKWLFLQTGIEIEVIR